MPKFPKPFFRTARKAWFVQVAGKQVNLGPERDAALLRYHELMGRTTATPQPVSAESVLPILDSRLEDRKAMCGHRRAACL
jgi:hypothetical protein